MKKLAVITTHPIQYNAPWFKLLAERGNVKVKVFYTWGEGVLKKKFDPGFGKVVEWDIPLLEGYEYEWVKNISNNPGSHHFRGIDNPELIQSIEQWGADAVLIFGWAFKSHLKAMRHFKNKIPVLFRGDSTLLDEPSQISLKSLLRLIFLRWVYRHIDVALYVGSANRLYFSKMGVKDSQLVNAPHAVDNKRFNEDRKEEVQQFRLSLGVSESDILITYAGKLEPVKNLLFFLRAWMEANSANNVFCLIVGNGSEEQRLKDFAAASGNTNVLFMDFQNQQAMPVVYQSSEIFCLPSRSETWGLAINEAMAAGCAILASDKCGAAQDLIDPGKNGYIFKSDDEASLVHYLKLMLADREKLKQMGRASQERIRAWNYEAIALAVEETVNKHS